MRAAFGEDSDRYCRAVKKVIEHALDVLESRDNLLDREPEMEETLAVTPTYLSRSRSEIVGSLATTNPSF